MVQFFWKIIWKFLIKLNIILLYDPAFMLWGLLREIENLCPHKICTLIFIIVSFIIVKTQKQDVFQEMNRQINIQRVEYSVLHEISYQVMSLENTWMKQTHINKWKKPRWKCDIIYNSNHMTFWKVKIIETVKRSMIARG